MQAILFYITFPLIYLISKSGFWVLYRISDFMFFIIYYVVGYRKEVVLKNLRNSFPEKSPAEITKISRAFYVYLCDLILESLKTITWKEKHVQARVKMNNTELLDELYGKGQSFIIVMGHYGNWEWAGPSFSLSNKHQLFVVYYPLVNPYWEKVFVKARTKFSTKIVKRKDALRSIVSNRKEIGATALIADQAPVPYKNALWMNFLNQETAVFNGPEKIAKKMKYPVVYMDVRRTGRGYYEVTPTMLCEDPNKLPENGITIAFNKLLEEKIIDDPATWLWSHKRWKVKRPEGVERIDQ